LALKSGPLTCSKAKRGGGREEVRPTGRGKLNRKKRTVTDVPLGRTKGVGTRKKSP